jgi:hypothetical protein
MKTDEAFVHNLSEGGVAADHAPAAPFEALVAPALAENERNTIKSSIIPFACWRAHDLRFEFGSSFPLPEIRLEMASLKALFDHHSWVDEQGNPKAKPVLSVFGHADPTGADDYNKQLSGRRAQAVYALLTRQVNLWEDLRNAPLGEDKWGPEIVQIMAQSVLSTGGETSQTSVPALVDFQRANGLVPDGIAGPNTRKKLYRAYMDFICVDATGAPYALDTKDFLGQGADSRGKGDYQGCGEFNPILVFSEADAKKFADPGQKPERDPENAPNRRVVIFLYRPGLRVDPSLWPCPRVKEGVAGCRKRFWSDGEARRSQRLPDEARKYEATQDTFACRFYDRMATHSPCERVTPAPSQICFIFLQLFDETFETILSNRPYIIQGLLRGTKIEGKTNAEGVLRHEQLPDDQYELVCDNHNETVEPFYMSEMELHEEPWFMRMRGISASAPPKSA